MEYTVLDAYKGISPSDSVVLENDIFIDDYQLPFKKSDITLPVKSRAYTVREIIQTPHGVGIRLKEIKNQKFFFKNIEEYQEPFFSIERFIKN